MKGDFTRDTFDSTKHYQQVLMQQGRAQVDADWNEQAELSERRDETTTADLIGNCGGPADGAAFGVVASLADLTNVPAAVANWFNGLAATEKKRITVALAKGDFLLTPGRYYVDGTQCELESPVLFSEQPDRFDVEALTKGSYLLHLDVWQRHITAVEDPQIREPALGGPDTATRVQTIWQVRVLELIEDNPDCSSGAEAFAKLFDLGTAKLTASTASEQAPDDPCIVPPSGGYKGLENQLYRVEIHDPGAAIDDASDNDSVEVSLPGDPQDQIIVTSGAAVGDAVEIYPTKTGSPDMKGQLVWVTGISDEPGLGATVPLYRLLNSSNGDHFYTSSVSDRDSAIADSGYVDEGVAGYIYESAVTGTTDLYRLFNEVSGDHFYTVSATERQSAIDSLGYTADGVAGYIYENATTGTTALYRLLSSVNGDHFYTVSATERDSAIANFGYTSEGIAGYLPKAVLTLNVPVTGFVADDLPRLRHASATWKWSRDNGSVVTAIVEIKSDDKKVITVSSLGPDQTLGFAAEGWVEILDDKLELEGKPGQLAQIDQVDESTRTITLKTEATYTLASDRHPKVRRWDGIGVVKFVDDDVTNWLPLESGVQVRFAGDGDYRTGHYWLIPARAATAASPNGEIEWPLADSVYPIAVPPKGITHHFCRLGIVTVSSGTIEFTDCRCLYPALTTVPRLYYVGGGGQEISPDAPAIDGLYKLPQPLVVGVANAQCLEKPLWVRFTVTQGDGRVVREGGDVTTATNEVGFPTDFAGLASCDFYLRGGSWSQQVTARLLDSTSSPVSLPITFEANLSDEGESCDCTVCVIAEQHNQGTFTIQQAVDQVLQTGGTICLGPGTFNLAKPVQVSKNTLAIRIRGQGSATVVIQPPDNAAFIITHAQWCTLDHLKIKVMDQPGQSGTAPAIRLSWASDTTIEHLIFGSLDSEVNPSVGILLDAGWLVNTRICENFFVTEVGVQFALTNVEDSLTLWAFYCEDNFLLCTNRGIHLDGGTYLYDIVVARNHIFGTAVAGIYLTGEATGEVDVTGNTIKPSSGDGILIGSSSARVSDNEVVNTEEKADVKNGIRLMPSPTQILDDIVITHNRLEGLNGSGITIETQLGGAVIEDNIVSGIQVLNEIQAGGIIMLFGSSAERLSVLNNQITDIDGTITPGSTLNIAGIVLQGVSEGSISSNQISGIGVDSPTANVIAGIRVESCVDVRISDNTITKIAPASYFSSQASGILIKVSFMDIEIADNLIRRQFENGQTDTSDWEAIRILGSSNGDEASRSLSEAIFPNIDKLSTAGIVAAVGNFAAAISLENEQVGILSNSLSGYGGHPLVEVQVSGSCRFSDNYCSSTLSDNAFGVIELSAASVIVSANRVECDANINALDLTVTDVSVGKPPHPAGAVLGNIVGGLIELNLNPLDANWKPLNMQVI